MDGGGPSLNQFSKSKPQFVQQVRLVSDDEDEQSFVSVNVLREQFSQVPAMAKLGMITIM